MAQGAPFVGREEDVERLVDWAAGSSVPGALVLADAGAGKSRLVQEVSVRAGGLRPVLCRATPRQSPALRSLVAAAAGAPTLLVVEDVHWLGADGLEVLGDLLRSPAAGLRLLATAREGELAIERWVARAVRDGVLQVVALRGLRTGEVAELLAAHLGRPPQRDLVARVARLSGGNPRYVEELARHEAVGGGERLPTQLLGVVDELCRDLSPAALVVLQAVAVAGGDVAHPDLAGVVPGGVVDDGCREAVAARVLEVTADGRGYRFRSELARAACYQGLLPPERRDLHRRWERVLAGSGPDLGALQQLARHAAEAGDEGRALHWSLRAAEEAERQGSWDSALSAYGQALPLWPAGRPVAVVAAAARAAALAGEPGTGVRWVEQALRRVDPGAEPVAAAVLEERRARLLGSAADDAGRRAVELAGGSAVRPRALATHSLLLSLCGQAAAAAAPATEALALAGRAGSVADQAAALLALGTARALSTDRAGGDRSLSQGLELARSAGDLEDLLVGYELLLETQLLLDDDLSSVVALGEDLQPTGGADTGGLRLCAAAAHHELGQWELAAQQARAAARRPDARLLLRLVAAWRGEPPPGLRESGDDEGGFLLRGLAVLLHGCWLAERQLLHGAAAEAAATVAAALARLVAQQGVRPGSLVVLGVRAQADLATAGRDTGDAGTVRDAQEQADDLSGRLDPADGPVGAALSATCAGERSRAAGASDPAAWQAAATAWSELSRLPRTAYARRRQAEALLADRAHRRDAGPVLVEALALADRLGAAPLRDELELLARQAHLPLDRGEPEPPPVAGPVLTPRERDVLELLAEGLSNRAIAAALVVSPKTVDTHVAHLLVKLDVHDRVAAAGRAQRLGVLRR